MSNNSGDEDDERFYESLDRIPSASSSGSTSDDDAPSSSFQHMAASSMYDVWISEPSSIEERRKRLLQNMGLSGDRSLSRPKEAATSSSNQRRSFRDGEMERSASYEEIHTQQREDDDSNSIIARSRSDGSATTSDSNSDSLLNNHCNSPIHHSIHSIQSIRSLQPIQSDSDTAFAPSFVYNNHHSFRNGSLASSFVSPNKPPSGRSMRRVDGIRGENSNSNSNGNANPDSPVSSANGDFDSGDPDVTEHHQACTIKNLDNGEEFVIKEVGEDGMWNKLREVGTGRQLTIEEFEMCVGHSPIVQELMRRHNAEELHGRTDGVDSNGSCGDGLKSKKKGSWFKSIKNVASTVTGYKDRRNGDERDTPSEKGGRRSSSATDDSQDVSFHTPVKIKVRHYGKSCRELTALFMSQEIHAHKGSIWSIKFSLDGRHLASAGEDRVIHVWQVMESERKGDLLTEKPEEGISNSFFVANGSPEPILLSSNADYHLEKKKRGKGSSHRRFLSSDHLVMPDNMFALSEKPVCSFRGHLDDVLDLSWSRSQSLLSSSMDKTVRLWDMSSNSCLKIFSHSDYVTCIQFNPVDDNYFISGSLDAKVRIWSIRDRQVVDYNELHEMVTAACYTPDGQGALVGSYKGSCRLYNTSDNKLQQKSQINLHNKKKKSHLKKITGFQFAPGSSSEALITSADSRIRVIDGADLVHKFKGFRNTNSQISASLTVNGKYVISASEDSSVYVWGYDGDSHAGRSKSVTVTQSYEHFPCEDVSVAIPWPGICTEGIQKTCNRSREQNGDGYHPDKVSTAERRVVLFEEANRHKGGPQSAYGCTGSLPHSGVPNSNITSFSDRVSATWPEEKLVLTTNKPTPQGNGDFGCWRMQQGKSAWGMVIVTAGLGGKIKTFQNFGLPIRI